MISCMYMPSATESKKATQFEAWNLILWIHAQYSKPKFQKEIGHHDLTWVVPWGRQQKTASTFEKSASLTATMSGKSCSKGSVQLALVPTEKKFSFSHCAVWNLLTWHPSTRTDHSSAFWVQDSYEERSVKPE
jgi:hypothetical protein